MQIQFYEKLKKSDGLISVTNEFKQQLFFSFSNPKILATILRLLMLRHMFIFMMFILSEFFRHNNPKLMFIQR